MRISNRTGIPIRITLLSSDQVQEIELVAGDFKEITLEIPITSINTIEIDG